MPKSSKYNRARIRSRVRRSKHRTSSRGWMYATIGVIVVGVILVVLSYSARQESAAAPPQIGDHIHAYLGVNVCGDWIAHAPSFEDRANEPGVQAGIHSHGDGLIHIHPFASDETGKNATVGRFFDYGGWKLSGSDLDLASGPNRWDGTHQNGQQCNGTLKGPATIQWKVGRHNQPWPTTARSGNPADYKPSNGDIIAIYFVPKGSPLEQPPGSNEALDNIQDLGGQPATGQTVPSSTPGAPSTTPPPSAPATSPSSTP